VANITTWVLYLQQRALVFIEYEVEWGPKPVWEWWTREKYLDHAGIPITYYPAHNLVTVLTSISWLRFKCSTWTCKIIRLAHPSYPHKMLTDMCLVCGNI